MPIRLHWSRIPPEIHQAPLLDRCHWWIASALGTGLFPASGTWGALLAFLLHNFLFPDLFTYDHWTAGAMVLIAVTAVGTWSADRVEKITGQKDDSRVTIDEVVGYFVAVMFLPTGWVYTIPAFVVCRIFDIVKPPPARQLQFLHGGVGIMIDDIIASVYACLLMHIALWII